MMQVPAHPDVHNHFLDTLVRTNALWINSRIYSIATDVGNGLISKYFRLSRRLLFDSALAIVLILGLVLGSIQKSTASAPLSTETGVTTFSPATTGEFSIVTSDVATVDMHTTRMPITFAPRRIATSTPVTSSIYSGSLSLNSPIFSRPNGATSYYYYKTILVTVSTTATYSFTSASSMDTYGYFYNDYFNPSYPSQNLVTFNDDSIGNQFRINVSLSSARTYFLVVTTYREHVMGSFSITAIGPAVVYFTWVTPSITTSTPVVSPIYYGILSSSSPIFSRPNGATSYYYYQTIQVTVFTTGTYSFASNSSMDTYGYFYNDYFNPSYPSQNLMTSNDDSIGNQFRINVSLSSARTYFLVVTTFAPDVMGNFSITVLGPASVGLPSFLPSTTNPSCNTYGTCYTNNTNKTGMIVGITVGCTVLCLIILCIYLCRRKPKPVYTRESNPSASNQSVPANVYRRTYVDRNATRTNAVEMPYTILIATAYTTNVEEPPPSYDEAVSSLNAQGR